MDEVQSEGRDWVGDAEGSLVVAGQIERGGERGGRETEEGKRGEGGGRTG